MKNEQKQSCSFHDVKLSPSEQIGLHRQDSWELSWVITGAGMRIIGDTKEKFTGGEVVLIPPKIPHCWYFGNETTDKNGKIANITLTFGNDFLEKCANFTEFSEICTKFQQQSNAIKFSGETLNSIISILKAMRHENASERILSILKLTIMIAKNTENQQIAGKYQKTDKEQNRLNQIEIFVICNAKRKISISEIARHVGMNKSAFCVFFKKAAGQTFISYLNAYRIELACKLLKESDLNISDICYEVGFEDFPYFNRVFKKIKRVTPSKYR
ncbi:MAG: AraC family transcriptional regulator [Prevotellaceae bacterium]|jgi:AraC-like DNA-binding protein/quercetin dioxygenase-like cupin family protein|nr:AraC family transcriptional regulator [Prevotellaceae bacterium]